MFDVSVLKMAASPPSSQLGLSFEEVSTQAYSPDSGLYAREPSDSKGDFDERA